MLTFLDWKFIRTYMDPALLTRYPKTKGVDLPLATIILFLLFIYLSYFNSKTNYRASNV
jgi:hypothetical protein